MSRPPGVVSLPGFALVNRLPRMHRAFVPQTDPRPLSERPGMALSAFGLVLERSLVTRPARDRFPTGAEGDVLFAAHLEELGERLRAACPEVRRATRSHAPGCYPQKAKPAIFRDGRPISWLDLRTLNCAGCRRVLLGPSDECVRQHAASRRSGLPTARAARILAALPPPVAGRVHDRPVCAACLPAPEVRCG